MKKILGGLLAVTVLTGIMGLHSAEAAPHLKNPPPHMIRIEHHQPVHRFSRHHGYVLVRVHKWLDHRGHRHMDRIWRDRHGHRPLEHVF